MAADKARLFVIGCSYQIEPGALSRWIAKGLNSIARPYEGVIVCNGSHSIPSNGPLWKYIRGTNSNLDLGAYREGVESIQPTDLSLFLFLNDSLITKHGGTSHLTELLKYVDIVSDACHPVIAGKTDEYNSICYYNPWSKLPVYVCSFCFLANRSCLDYVIEVNKIADSVFDQNSRASSDAEVAHYLDRNFSLFLDSHLKYSGTGLSWYQLATYKSDSNLVHKKRKCVFMEHRLSGFVGLTGSLISIYSSPRSKLKFFLNEQKAKIARKLYLNFR